MCWRKRFSRGSWSWLSGDAIAIWWYNRIRARLSTWIALTCRMSISYRTLRGHQPRVLGTGRHARPGHPYAGAVCRRTRPGGRGHRARLWGAFRPEHRLVTRPHRGEPVHALPSRCTTPTAALAICSRPGPSNGGTATIATSLPGPARDRAGQVHDYPAYASNDLKEDVDRCVEIAARQGLETLVLDQTQPTSGCCRQGVCARCATSGGGWVGLYDVPVKLGWLPEPQAEDKLNPRSVFSKGGRIREANA